MRNQKEKLGKTITCPWCGYKADAAAGVNHEDRPEPGDRALCFNCGEWSIFDDNMDYRKPTLAEFVEIGLDEDCRIARMAWVGIKGSTHSKP